MKEEITSRENPHIKQVKKLISTSKNRYKEKKFVIEGLRLSLDAVESKIKILEVFYTKEANEKYNELILKILNCAEESTCVNNSVMDYISDTKAPQGILCVCKMSDVEIKINDIKETTKMIAFENIQDPSNMGTLLRTAEALGIKKIILSKDCCDIYNPKVLRGSMGSAFRLLYLHLDDFSQSIKEFKNMGFKTYASTPDINSIKITNINFNEKCIVFIGNEGNGLKTTTINECDDKITIPMLGRAESLNAATAANIIMWEMFRT